MSLAPQSVAYKESGIPWVGKIPEHWEILPLQAVFQNRSENNSDKRISLILSLVKDLGIIPYEEKGDIGNKSKDDLSQYKIARENDIVLNKMNAVIGSIGISKYVGLVSPIYLVLAIRNHELFSPLYFSRMFEIKALQESLSQYASGIMKIRESIDYLDFKKMHIPLPPLQEQKAIADFLDKKTHQIEEFITKKQKLITLLEEKKQTLINQCVTQGLDPSTPLKDSGVEWIGKIPTHWEVKKLKLLFGIGSGLGITKADFVPSGIPCVSYGEIHSKYPCRLNTGIHPLPYVSEDYLSSKPQALLKKGDFVFADTSEDIEGSGNFTSLQSDDPVFAGYHTIVLKPKTQSIHSPYFSFLFDSLGIRNQVRKEVCGVKVYSITKSILKEVQCLIPPLEEQKAIAEYLDTQIEKIDLAICKIKSQINLIKEYKTTLIPKAVCGRVEIN